MKTLILPIVIVALIFTFVSFRAGLISLSLLFIKFVSDLGVFSSIKFYTGKYPNSEVFYKEYTGEYSKVGPEFEKLNKILEKFVLTEDPKYSTFGIYYDSPQKVVDRSKCRAVIGIYKEIFDDIRPSKEHENTEFNEYLNAEGFKRSKIPDTVCIYAAFSFIYKMSMKFGIIKYYKSLMSNLKNEDFQRQFKIKEQNITQTVEVYHPHEIKFFIPMKNQEKFMITSQPAPEYKH